MGDSYGDPQQRTRNHEVNRDNSRGGFRGGRNSGGRGPGGREGGGFRIRLSDNEMRAASSLQEAFNLRSTVAVLGFAIRTLSQLLEEGKLDELVAQSRSQTVQNDNRSEEGRQVSRKDRFNGQGQSFNKNEPKPNPFARPAKPQASITEEPQEEDKQEQISDEQEELENEGQVLAVENPTEVQKEVNETSNTTDEGKSNSTSES